MSNFLWQKIYSTRPRSRRNAAGTPTSKHAFVGGLGHPSEDETGMIYMRARYMDPVVGRFASEDPGRSGINWFIYASDDPVMRSDSSGREDSPLAEGLSGLWDFIKQVLGSIDAFHIGDLFALKFSAADLIEVARATREFLEVAKSQDSSMGQVEDAWQAFMGKWSEVSDVGAIGGAGTLYGSLNGGGVGLAIAAGTIGAELGCLDLAYSGRVGYYINQID